MLDNSRGTAETPLGGIVAYKATDPEHPRVYIDLIHKQDKAVIPLALVEDTDNDNDPEIAKDAIITRVWENGRSYTKILYLREQTIMKSKRELLTPYTIPYII